MFPFILVSKKKKKAASEATGNIYQDFTGSVDGSDMFVPGLGLYPHQKSKLIATDHIHGPLDSTRLKGLEEVGC